MSREILFRGKRKDNDEWTEGYFFKSWDRTFLLWGMTGDSPNMVEVIPETIGQYTGLTDKNGKNIFEGDIVKREYTLWHGETKKTRETQIGGVAYSNKECGFRLDKVCNLRKPWDGDTLEVIGNIHD